MDAGRLLVTPDELRAYDYARRVEALHNDGTPEEDTFAERILGAAQDGLHGFLGYDPLVHKVTTRRLRWAYPTGTINGRAVASDGVPWVAYGAGTGPIVQVDAGPYGPSGEPDYYTVTISADGYTLNVASDVGRLPAFVDLWEGYRGTQHVISDAPGEGEVDLRTLDGLDGLEALPPLLPDGFFTAICEAALFLALRPGLLGVTTVEVDTGAQVKRIEGARPLADLTAIYAQHAGRRRRINA